MFAQKTIFLTVTLGILTLTLPLMTSAIGQMTKPIVFEDIMRGQEVEETLTVYNSDKESIIYEITAEGDIAGWVSFYQFADSTQPIDKITVPAESRLNVLARFLVPEDAANREYNGQVTIMTVPSKEKNKEGASASVRLKVSRPVTITVTDKEIIDLEATFIPKSYDIQKDGTLEIRVIYENHGNVAIKPDLELKILRAGQIIDKVIFPYPENEEPVGVRQRKEIESIKWSSVGKDKGTYFAHLNVLYDGKPVDEQEFRFNVGKQAPLWLAAIVNFFGGNFTLVWFVLGGFFAILAGIFALYYKKPQLLRTGINKFKSIF